jgi:hypothetical protein
MSLHARLVKFRKSPAIEKVKDGTTGKAIH